MEIDDIEAKVKELSRIELLLISHKNEWNNLRQEKAALLGYKPEGSFSNRDIDKVKLAEINLNIERLNRDINDLVQQKDSLLGRQSEGKSGFFIFIFIITVFLAIFINLISSLFLSNRNSYIDKNLIQDKIFTVIQNNAPLNIVKNIYDSRDFYKISTKDKIFNLSEISYYNHSISLTQILMDIQIKHYDNNNSNNLISIAKVEKIYKEYLQTNPFDSLEDSQKDLFNNISFKLNPQNYALIQIDVENISKELKDKNILVNKYLTDSTSSYILSIIAFILSIIIAIYQIFNSRAEDKKNKSFQLSVLSYLEKRNQIVE